MASPSMDQVPPPPPASGRRGSLRLQTRNMLVQNGVSGPSVPGSMSQSQGGNSSTMDLSNGRPPPVANSRASGLI